ncbi:MAG: aminotransferase class III-fold pyridoxal phosphate-dependent enzyme, partial [Bacteroidota bacterium]|nr:aminotransferase class III-fold pyridoxal phosphate-dependent enzyme [Bacteroidota bacterium]
QQSKTVFNISKIIAAIQNFANELKFVKAPIKNIRTLGTIIAFEISLGKDEYLNDVSKFVTQAALQQGIYLRPLGNTVYIMPPYCITDDELHSVFSVIKNILQAYE